MALSFLLQASPAVSKTSGKSCCVRGKSRAFTLLSAEGTECEQRVCLQVGALNSCSNQWRAGTPISLTAFEDILVPGLRSGRKAPPALWLFGFCCPSQRASSFTGMRAARVAFLHVLHNWCVLENCSWILLIMRGPGREEEENEIREEIGRGRILTVKHKRVLCQSLPVLSKTVVNIEQVRFWEPSIWETSIFPVERGRS